MLDISHHDKQQVDASNALNVADMLDVARVIIKKVEFSSLCLVLGQSSQSWLNSHVDHPDWICMQWQLGQGMAALISKMSVRPTSELLATAGEHFESALQGALPVTLELTAPHKQIALSPSNGMQPRTAFNS